FGAGSVQHLFELKGGAAMLLTVTKYADPAGQPFLKETPGITPTVEVKAINIAEEALPDDNDQSADGQTHEDVEAALPIEAAPALADDAQLKKGIESVKGNQGQEKHVAENEFSAPNTAATQLPERQRASRVTSRL